MTQACVDSKLVGRLTGHEVHSAIRLGWGGLKNGHLLAQVAAEGYDAFVTVDRSLSYQKHLARCPFSIIPLRARNNSLRSLAPLAPELLRVLPVAPRGQLTVVPAGD